VGLIVCILQGADLKASHKVQSHRGLIERLFARLKKWLVLQGGNVESIERREQEMDVAVALTNLNERVRQGLLGMIPGKAPCPPDAHIITRDLEPAVNIPDSMTAQNQKFPAHWKAFLAQMPSIVPGLSKVLKGEGEEAMFSTRVLKRGHNLFSGGFVAQFQLQILKHDVLRIQGATHASMRQACYTWFADLQQGRLLLQSACMCKSG
jgi:hypothetical protein